MAVPYGELRERETPLTKLLQDRRILFAAWALIALECIGALYAFRPWVIGDSHHYLLLAENLTSGRYGSVTAAGFEPDALRPPGYPVALWFLLHVIGLPRAAVVLVQLTACVGALLLVQRYLVSKGLNPTLFVLLAAIYPFPLIYSASLTTEAWTIMLTTAAALLLATRSSAVAYAGAGSIAAVAALFRADLLLLPIVFGAVVLLREVLAGSNKLSALGKACLPVVAASLVLLPYTMWNYSKFGRFSPSPAAGAVGTSLYLSTWARKLSWEDFEGIRTHRLTPAVERSGLAGEVRALNRSMGAPENILAFDPWAYPTVRLRIEASHRFLQAALPRIAADPATYANHVVHNVWELWVTKKYPPGLPTLVVIGLKLSSWLVFLLGVAGMATAILKPAGWAIPWTLVPVTLYPAAIHIWLHTEARYTASARPLLMLFAAAFVIWLVTRRTSRSSLDARSASASVQA